MKTLKAFAFFIVCVPTAQADLITFSDTEFSNGDWSIVEVGDTTPNNSFTFSGSQASSGGNPGFYRAVTNTIDTEAQSSVQAGHFFQGATFDPGAHSPLISIDFKLDGIGFDGPAGAMAYGIVLEQNGNFFGAIGGAANNGLGWMTFVRNNLTQDDFVAFDSGILDLSESGTPIAVGFFVSNGTFGTPSINSGGVDNWSVSFATVPEPATFTLFSLAAIVGSGWRFRSRRQPQN